MLDTNDIFNDAVKGSTLHVDHNANQSGAASKIVAVLLLASIGVVGFKFYTPTDSVDTDLVVTHELVAQNDVVEQIKPIKKRQLVEKKELVATATTHTSASEKAYLNALRGIESELSEERETVNLDTEKQLKLSSAMNSLVDDTTLSSTDSDYTKNLEKEVSKKSDISTSKVALVANKSSDKKTLKVIVKKGDTLQGLSDKFYGDAMDYKRIIASNDSLSSSDTIYEGQTIILPY